MKKIAIPLLLSLLSLFACKNNENDSKSTTEKINDTTASKTQEDDKNCIDFTDYYKIDPTDTNKKAQWLKNNGRQICTSILNQKVKDDHIVTDIAEFESMYEKDKPTTLYSWNEIKTIIGNNAFYDNWVNCNIDSNEKVILTMGNFSQINSCYSIPLFNYILANDLKPDELNAKIFEFKINTKKNKVVFTVKKNYNYSQQPTK